jgi:Na+-transporting methylmalonyl-CoA/oxaloacetate decarboxylase gamma subunit
MLELCQRQRVLSAKHYSVSVLGMAIILSIGSLLIMIDQSMEALWFRYFNAAGRLAKRAEWTQTGTLQLHRQALEARGVGNWDRKNRDFPVIERKGETFVGLGEREEMIGQMQENGKAPYTVVTTEESSLNERDKKSLQ